MDYLASTPLTMATTKAGLIAGTTTTLVTSVLVNYAIRGKAYSKAIMSNVATPTTDYATGAAFTPLAASQGCVFLIGLDHSGNVKVVQGSIQALDSNNNFITAPSFGPVVDDFCPIGYLVAVNASNGSAWTFGSTNWSGVTGFTGTFVDIMNMPDRPQIS